LKTPSKSLLGLWIVIGATLLDFRFFWLDGKIRHRPKLLWWV
jgi:hypothetical protein